MMSPTCTPAVLLISTPDGTTPGNGLSEKPSVSTCVTTVKSCATGQSIAFASLASNLSANVENGIENIFVRNPCLNVPVISTSNTAGCSPYTFLASKASGSSPPPIDGKSLAPSVSADGTTVSFISFADNLVPNDANALEDVFLASAIPTFGLTVTLAQTNNVGAGTVTDSTGQISCTETAGTNGAAGTVTGTCTARYPSGTAVTLTATASTSNGASTFVSWSGSVVGTNCVDTNTACTFAALQDNTATATFK